MSGGNYLWGNCPGAIIQGQLSWGAQYSSWAIVRGAIFLGGNCPDTSLLITLSFEFQWYYLNPICLLIVLLALYGISIKKNLPTSDVGQKSRNSLILRVCSNVDSIQSWKRPPDVFYRKGVLRSFAKFTGKRLC